MLCCKHVLPQHLARCSSAPYLCCLRPPVRQRLAHRVRPAAGQRRKGLQQRLQHMAASLPWLAALTSGPGQVSQTNSQKAKCLGSIPKVFKISSDNLGIFSDFATRTDLVRAQATPPSSSLAHASHSLGTLNFP